MALKPPQTSATEHWHILGAGSIGCLFSFWIKNRATLILRPDSDYADRNELQVCIEKNKEQTVFALPCISAMRAKGLNNLLICTKANQTEAALKGLQLNKHSNIVLLQNGMGNGDLLKERFPESNIFLGSTTHGAYRKSPFNIVYAGEGQTILGSLKQGTTDEALEKVCTSLSSKQQQVHADNEIEKRLWLKLAMNCAINPLTVIYQCKNGELLTKEQRLKHLELICSELDQILHHKNYLAKDQSCFDFVKQVANDTANNYSSMFQDHQSKQASEIDFIQGYLLKTAQELELSLPENQKVLATIKKIEAGY